MILAIYFFKLSAKLQGKKHSYKLLDGNGLGVCLKETCHMSSRDIKMFLLCLL